MSSSILIVDPAVTSRIVMKVNLLAARYEVGLAATLEEARLAITAAPPDLVLIDVARDTAAALAFCRDLRDGAFGGPRPGPPVIALGAFGTPDERLAALAAGADDVIGKPVQEAMLLARIRSLLRARAVETELALREDAGRLLGFSEAAEHFTGPGRTALVIPRGEAGMLRARALCAGLPGAVEAIAPEEALGAAGRGPDIDLFVIDASCLDADAFGAEILRLIPELRARSRSRLAGQLVVLPPGAEGMAGMVLDLGADDLVRHDVGMRELAHRARALVTRKRQQDRLRASLRDGLKAAVTDPLTGLWNRRYAEPQLRRMAERAAREARPLAIMVLDIDHFKAINDRWGHAAGDAVLREVASRLRGALRPEDLLARIGGEEFLVALPETGADRARRTAERLCALIDGAPFTVPGTRAPVAVSLSIGVALGGTPEDDRIEAIVGRADAALYAAKTAGRNTVSLSAA